MAVLHHISTAGRRAALLREVLRVTAPARGGAASGLVLVQAWALEQGAGDGGGGSLAAAVPHGAPGGRDLLVPWRMPLADPDPAGAADAAPDRLRAAAEAAGGAFDAGRRALVVQRFCHMFVGGELEALARAAVEGGGGGTLLGGGGGSGAEALAAAHPTALVVEVVDVWWERGNHAMILRRLQ